MPICRYRCGVAVFGIAALLAAAAPWMLGLTAAGEGLQLRGGTRLPELCLSKRLIHQPCVSCGMGRSYVLAAHGNLRESLRYHPGGALLWIWLLAQGVLHLGLACMKLEGRYWWLHIGITALSFLSVFCVIAFMSPAPGRMRAGSFTP
jgi:hypothetical protein